eukprot:6727914-Karenia_brevis.AAC.1
MDKFSDFFYPIAQQAPSGRVSIDTIRDSLLDLHKKLSIFSADQDSTAADRPQIVCKEALRWA